MAKNKNKDNTQSRYFDYLLTYTNTIHEYWEELEILCKKKKSWELKIGKRKHTYFSINNWVTILNRKNDLEMSFSFNTLEDFIEFEKYKFHNFIESDLNASWLGQSFQSNKTLRTEEFNDCFDKILMSWVLMKSWEKFKISVNELY